MKSKIFFRIFGALASALMIVAIFVPFVSTSNYSQSLLDTYKAVDTLYLPIMIIIFGAIGVLFFSLNIKTEFAYMSSGAILFFVITQTVDVINNDMFSTMGIGYYFLAIGAILTGIMAFICNLRVKKPIDLATPSVEDNQPSMLDQIDKLYNDQNINNQDILTIQPIDNTIQPISVQSIEPIDNTIQPISVQSIEPIQVESQPFSLEKQVQATEQVESQTIQVETVQQPSPVIQQLEQPVMPEIPQQSVNPVLQQLEQPVIPVVQQQEITVQPTNPVLEQFTQSTQPINAKVDTFISNNVEMEPPVVESTKEPQTNNFNVPLDNINNTSDVVQNQNVNISANNVETDIFGQPINR